MSYIDVVCVLWLRPETTCAIEPLRLAMVLVYVRLYGKRVEAFVRVPGRSR